MSQKNGADVRKLTVTLGRETGYSRRVNMDVPHGSAEARTGKKRLGLRKLSIFCLGGLLGALWPLGSVAGPYYLEWGVGASQLRNAPQYFDGATANTAFGLGVDLTFAYSLSHAMAPMQVHVGLQNRFATSSESTTSTYSTNTLYPLLRLEFPTFSFGFGASPFIFAQEGENLGVSGMEPQNGIQYVFEANLLWRVVPFFHMALQGSTQLLQRGASFRGSPTIEFGLQFRFLYGDTQGHPEREYQGWRYPYGIEKN